MHTTPSERQVVYDEFLSTLMGLEPGEEYTSAAGVHIECITTSNFKLDDIEGYGLFAAADTLADKHRQYCQ
jgi:hypothetical protein